MALANWSVCGEDDTFYRVSLAMKKYSHPKRKRMGIAKTIIALFLCLASSAPSYADATDLIPPEYCGVVVASEKSIPLLMASPNLAVYANHQVWVFGTNKGAFAAVVGITRKEGREGIFGELLENGFIMDDAFCSGGDKFWGLAAEPPEGPLPVFGELPQPEQAGEELIIPPVRNVSPEEILAVQPIQEGPLDMMLPQVKKMGSIYHDHAISMGTGSAGNTVGDGLLEPYRCANIARALGMTESLGEGGAFQYLQPNDDPYEFLQISAELDVWVATAEAVMEMSHDQRVAMWNLECVGNHGIPFETYRQDEAEGADLVVKDGILNVLGGIDFGFYDRFTTVLDAHPEIIIISLGSGGGSVADALQAGELIRERGLKTQLYGKCFSACPMVFAGGVERIIYWPSKAALGFHQIYTDDGPVPMTSEVYDVLRAYLEKMGVDADTFIGMMTRAGPENMYEPDVADLCKPLIATWVQRTCNAETP